MKLAAAILFVPLLACAEVRTLTLKEAVEMAIRQNPDLVMARLDRVKSQLAVDVQRDPFSPKVFAGSGAAYTNGFPLTINGNPPSLMEARAVMTIYSRPQTYLVAEARENARGSDIEVSRQQDEVVYRTASLYLNAQQLGRASESAARQVDGLQRVLDNVRLRVADGRELPIQARKAELDVAKARQRSEGLRLDRENAESSLALVLGLGPDDRVRPVPDEQIQPVIPNSEETSVEDALANNKQMKLLQSQMQAKSLEVKSYQSQRWPTVDLIAQYSMLAKYNFDYYSSTAAFQRHNGQLGASFSVPLLMGRSSKAYAAQGEADLAKLRTQYNTLRHQLVADSRKAFEDVKRAEMARDVAKLDLEVAREQLQVYEAQYDEGRISIREVETARVQESEKSLAYYQSQNDLEKVRLNLLRQTGTLSAALR
jgi:outer membrane protein TolC